MMLYLARNPAEYIVLGSVLPGPAVPEPPFHSRPWPGRYRHFQVTLVPFSSAGFPVGEQAALKARHGLHLSHSVY